jgi:pyrimidine-nucleoside phosphorylase
LTGVTALIDELARLGSEAAMSRLAVTAKGTELGSEDISRIANALARSGSLLSFGEEEPTADLASTGAPSSLSTLLCPLYLRARGLTVPKLGVPGRPAGGIDVLAQIPGYAYRLDPAGIRRVIDVCGYAHFVADENFAPLDKAFFSYRQKAGFQDVPALAAASLLAKKIACGVRYAGLDVRVAPHGNFGSNWGEAGRAARKFCDASRLSGIKAVAILTDARTPYQPFIGRGEALLALSRIFSQSAESWLAEHADRCRLMAEHVAALASGKAQVDSGSNIAPLFAANVEAQGGSMDAFATKAELVSKGHTIDLTAPTEGFFRVDLGRVRSIFVNANVAATPDEAFPDRLGLILLARPGAYVQRGHVLATVRADDAVWGIARNPLGQAFQIADLLDYAPGVEEIVRA